MKQQLTNTDDIRRIRRKVPFTSIEGLKSYKVSDIQQLFLEPSLPGQSFLYLGVYAIAFRYGLN